MRTYTIRLEDMASIQSKGVGAYEDHLYQALDTNGFDLSPANLIKTEYNLTKKTMTYTQKTVLEAQNPGYEETKDGLLVKSNG